MDQTQSMIPVPKQQTDRKSAGCGHCGATLSDKLERVQNYALRIIQSKPPRTRSEPLRRALGMSTLRQRRHINMLSQVHRCQLQHAPSFLATKFACNSENYTSTRGANNIHLKRPQTEWYRSSFEFEGAKQFNSLPETVRSIKNVRNFRKAVSNLS